MTGAVFSQGGTNGTVQALIDAGAEPTQALAFALGTYPWIFEVDILLRAGRPGRGEHRKGDRCRQP